VPIPDERYISIWEYQVPPAAEADFLTHYAPDGTWARLFRRSSEHLGTELYRDCTRPDRFVTVDRWRSETAFREFRSRFAVEYEALDRQCARLTRHEAVIGEFRLATTPGG
jgi:heme-degrading monooxygenase HmoA